MAKHLLTPTIIQRELMRLVVGEVTFTRMPGEVIRATIPIRGQLVVFHFPAADLALSLDDFTDKHLAPLCTN